MSDALKEIIERINRRVLEIDESLPFYTVEIYTLTLPDKGVGKGETIYVEVQAVSPHAALIKAISEFRPLDEDEYFTHISVSGPRVRKP